MAEPNTSCETCGLHFHKNPAFKRRTNHHFCTNSCRAKAMNVRCRKQFITRIRVVGECWEWSGSINRSGYGTTRAVPGESLAHRASWILHNGPIPEGLLVCHRCDNRPCIRPEHLFLGTNEENMKDMVDKQRQKHTVSRSQIEAIRSSGESEAILANRYGVTPRAIRRYLKGIRRFRPRRTEAA